MFSLARLCAFVCFIVLLHARFDLRLLFCASCFLAFVLEACSFRCQLACILFLFSVAAIACGGVFRWQFRKPFSDTLREHGYRTLLRVVPCIRYTFFLKRPGVSQPRSPSGPIWIGLRSKHG